MLLRKDFQELAELRLRESAALFAGHYFDGAFYLGGLGLECALKACVARKAQEFQFPDAKWANRVNTHQLAILLNEAGLENELKSAPTAVGVNWADVKNWKIESRYEIGKSEAECRDFLAAVSGQDGVLQWLKLFW
ncbi:MAG TPA: hypothetical protein VMU82_17075 [Acetobacteraceae bacterium]|nr:hypothetical protein [Acetobacteraceae bacterium]